MQQQGLRVVQSAETHWRAGFVVMACGGIMTTHGLTKVPLSAHIDIGARGKAVGLF